MKKNDVLEEIIDIKKMDVPVIFHHNRLDKINGRGVFSFHWHNKIELLYMTSGEAVFTCNRTEVTAKKGDLIVVNCNELHSGQTKTDVSEYYCFIVDYSFFGPLKSDAADIRYIKPVYENMIIFENLISGDRTLMMVMEEMIHEISEKRHGYELALKSGLLKVLLFLFRSYARYKVTPKEYARRLDKLGRFDPVFSYIDEHYTEDISIDELCAVVNISRYRFCHLFKELTGMSAVEYINRTRTENSKMLLDKNELSIDEISQRCGFDDSNYFTRVFKRYNGISPKKYAKKTM